MILVVFIMFFLGGIILFQGIEIDKLKADLRWWRDEAIRLDRNRRRK